MKLSFQILILILIVVSCENGPNNPNYTLNQFSNKSVYILCEGVWGSNNSSLSRIDFNYNSIINNYIEYINPNIHLGDIANNMVLFGDTIFIAVTTSQTIEAISASTGKWLNRIILEGHKAPRNICIINDSTAFFTDLYDNSIQEFNPRLFKLKNRKISVGPAPEGITCYESKLFIANSGYGDILANKPKAGTISVIDIQSGIETQLLTNVPDVIEVLVSKKLNSLFALYNNLPSLKDSLGGIVQYDLNSLNEINRWFLHPKCMKLSVTEDSLLFFNSNSVYYIELKKSQQINLLIQNPNINNLWYSYAISPFDNSIWVGNANNFQINGGILVYNLNYPNMLLNKFTIGINPNTILFYEKK